VSFGINSKNYGSISRRSAMHAHIFMTPRCGHAWRLSEKISPRFSRQMLLCALSLLHTRLDLQRDSRVQHPINLQIELRFVCPRLPSNLCPLMPGCRPASCCKTRVASEFTLCLDVIPNSIGKEAFHNRRSRFRCWRWRRDLNCDFRA
jgi:hypothetical protein